MSTVDRTNWAVLMVLSLTAVNTGLLMMTVPDFNVGHEIARVATIPFVLSFVCWVWQLLEDVGLGDAIRSRFGGETA